MQKTSVFKLAVPTHFTQPGQIKSAQGKYVLNSKLGLIQLQCDL